MYGLSYEGFVGASGKNEITYVSAEQVFEICPGKSNTGSMLLANFQQGKRP